jgi:DNA-binding NtrC family response regulator
MIIQVPPLRERRDAIEPLATHFLEQANHANQRQLLGFDPDAMAALERHDWPGNVRELRNAVERAAVIARGETVALADLPETVRARGSSVVATAAPEENDEADLDFKTRVQRFEAALLERALEECGFNQTETSRRLHIPIRTLANKIKQYAIRKR